jgi:arginyl-tRNA synthetase
MNLLHLLQEQARQALRGLVADPESAVAMLRQTQDLRHGDYQLNSAMSLAKELGRKPRDVAAEIAQRFPLGDFLQPPEVAGPGFINLRFRDDWLAARLRDMACDERLGVARAEPPRTVVIDYSSPNVAKPMHVGHLRSTIIGDSLARLFRFLGHHVITDNHLGDWGTQFGMLLYGYKYFRDEEAVRRDPVGEMVRLYKMVRELIKPVEEDESGEEGEPRQKYTVEEVARARDVQAAVRQETARLHEGDPEIVALWKQFMPWCVAELERTYRRLDVHFDHQYGESFYNPMLPEVVADLQRKGIARESEGAVAIFFGEGQAPALVRKRDGAFTYTTTDLATIRYRVEHWHPDTILYVVDFRQALHFRSLFDAARRWGYDRVALEHVSFGSVLDPVTRKPLKTREGTAANLGMLLDEAVRQAGVEYEESRRQRLDRGEEVPELTEGERRDLGEAVGIGAVKYADLCQNRTSDYAFNLQKMLAMEGNTATYMQYAYVRNRGIFRKGGEAVERFRTDPPPALLQTPQERALGLALMRLQEALTTAAAEFQPSAITSYLWDLAKSYSAFFQHCPVLRAETPELRESRLLLCDLTGRVIKLGLHLLGIRTVERM